MAWSDYLNLVMDSAKKQYAKGQPYRAAVGGLLSGDTSALQELNRPSPVMPNEALDIAMTFAPMGIVGGDITKILKSLKQQNPSTYPKIPVNKIFKNEVGNLESLDRMKADEGFLNNATTNQFVNINDIIPTQKNVTTKNIKDINNVSALPELIKVNDKYYVNDGHHRISRDILTGDDKIQAKVYERLLQNKTPLTDFEVKQLTAQKNAALPVSEGGLGLPVNNTAMDRAKAMGFDTPAYHATNSDIKAFIPSDVGTYGPGVYTAKHPEVAEGYYQDIGSSNTLPLLINKGKEKQFASFSDYVGQKGKSRNTFDYGQDLRNEGYNSLNVKFFPEGEVREYASFNPSDVRSTFAAFDPFRRNEADILAGVGVGIPVSSGLLNIEEKKEPKKAKKKSK
jgi:hypothetical protein